MEVGHIEIGTCWIPGSIYIHTYIYIYIHIYIYTYIYMLKERKCERERGRDHAYAYLKEGGVLDISRVNPGFHGISLFVY